MKRYKTLTREAMLRNINGLSVGDRAYCGPYGTVTCTKSSNKLGGAAFAETNKSGNQRGLAYGYSRNSRRFSVSGSKKLQNRGNWTMSQLRSAISK